jgi:hypothetical protein
MLFELFVVGSFWFWALIIAEFIFLIYFLERERYLAAPFSILLVLGAWVLGGSGLGDVIRWVYHNPTYTVAGMIGYFLIGTFYVISPYVGKWWWFVRDVRDHNREAKQYWLESGKRRIDELKLAIQNLTERQKRDATNNHVNPDTQPAIDKATQEMVVWTGSNGVMTEELLPYWKTYQKENYFTDWFGRQVSIEKPTPDKFKARITAWIVYWPPSLFWTLLNDPLRRIGRMIYEGVADILKKISDSAWKDEDKLG